MYLVLSAFTSGPFSLVATTRASAFSFTVLHTIMQDVYFFNVQVQYLDFCIF